MTKLLYFENSYLFESTAKVVEIGEHEGKTFVILDQTIFYPQGGGQPSDTGTITSENCIFEVQKCVFLDEKVYHFGEFTKGKFEIGEDVGLKVDEANRRLNARNHSAGHFIDLALEKLGIDWKPQKGYHWPAGAYVEYSGDLGTDLEIGTKIENTINEIIQTNPKISFTFKSGESHQSGKPMRIMSVECFKDCPCGGTHVQIVSDIGKVKIRKVKKSGDRIKVSYEVEG
jgi:Ser-tRNA(Ala) deacylase AlaX